METNSSKLEDIKHWTVVSHQGVHPSCTLSKVEFDWLIEQAEIVEELEKRIELLERKGY